MYIKDMALAEMRMGDQVGLTGPSLLDGGASQRIVGGFDSVPNKPLFVTVLRQAAASFPARDDLPSRTEDERAGDDEVARTAALKYARYIDPTFTAGENSTSEAQQAYDTFFSVVKGVAREDIRQAASHLSDQHFRGRL